MKLMTSLANLSVTSVFLAGLPAVAGAADYPTNRDDLVGPTFRTDANASGFTIYLKQPGEGGEADKVRTFCAQRKSSFVVTERKDKTTWVKFHRIGQPDPDEEAAYKLVCGSDQNKVSNDVVYGIPDAEFDLIPKRSSGVAYGALVVPFKFRLGDDKKISSSATIAPYIGARWHRFQRWGVEMMPIATAGLALVPISNPTDNKTDTKAAFSTAIGITLVSTTSNAFSAGVLVGKDFLGKTDRAFDPSVNKLWLSIWLGTSQ